MKIIKFKTPIQRGDETISQVELREPNAAALKGLDRMDLLRMNDEAHRTLIPKISTPMITPQMYNQLSLSDSQRLINGVVGFFAGLEELDEADYSQTE